MFRSGASQQFPDPFKLIPVFELEELARDMELIRMLREKNVNPVKAMEMVLEAL